MSVVRSTAASLEPENQLHTTLVAVNRLAKLSLYIASVRHNFSHAVHSCINAKNEHGKKVMRAINTLALAGNKSERDIWIKVSDDLATATNHGLFGCDKYIDRPSIFFPNKMFTSIGVPVTDAEQSVDMGMVSGDHFRFKKRRQHNGNITYDVSLNGQCLGWEQARQAKKQINQIINSQNHIDSMILKIWDQEFGHELYDDLYANFISVANDIQKAISPWDHDTEMTMEQVNGNDAKIVFDQLDHLHQEAGNRFASSMMDQITGVVNKASAIAGSTINMPANVLRQFFYDVSEKQHHTNYQQNSRDTLRNGYLKAIDQVKRAMRWTL
jgi:hypothetical protein